MEFVLSVGTNIGDRLENLKKCIDSINLIPYTDVIKVSSVYETEPVGYARQDNFYNICILVESILEPNEMLGACLGIEGAMGRKRTLRYGPRIIDLDVILAENSKVSSRNLDLPHPRFKERRFVLEPLLELFPDGSAYGIEFKSCLDLTKDQGIQRLDYKITV
ncbi:MAG: 2-amino-4-hydroxy-6-hydroxymethyldihydropteridine diphosphokinase [Eubacterium sp.]